MLNQLKKALCNTLTGTCVLCSAPSRRTLDLCIACERDLPQLQNYCQYCAQPLINTKMAICGACLKQAPPFAKTVVPYAYEEPIISLISGLKFQNKLVYARLLGSLLAQHLKNHYHHQALPACIIPIPLHAQRLQERGYNQAIELARPVSAALGIPLSLHDSQRIRMTVAQSSISAKERGKNVKGAFQVTLPTAIQHVAIIDDVITTGHTVTELSGILRNAGATTIDVWCCARTILH